MHTHRAWKKGEGEGEEGLVSPREKDERGPRRGGARCGDSILPTMRPEAPRKYMGVVAR